MSAPLPYQIHSLGDSAILVDFGNIICEEVNDFVLQLLADIEDNPIDGMIEAVPSYSSLAIYYDILKIKSNALAFSVMKDQLTEKINALKTTPNKKQSEVIRIPVCYDPCFGVDLQQVSLQTNLTTDNVIEIHTSKVYQVYMIGFLPGFAYMGLTDEKIKVSRKVTPVNIESGSVGLAGNQTGIYPLNSPGGWNIIGRTPVQMFLPEKFPPVYLKAGDRVQFFSIPYNEFENY